MDCIRAVLLWVEENQKIESIVNGELNQFMSTQIPQHIEEYSAEDVLYSIRQMIYSGLLDARVGTSEIYSIRDITPKGHEFIGGIRSNDNWDKTKAVAKKAGATTLGAVINISSKIVAEIIKSTLMG